MVSGTGEPDLRPGTVRAAVIILVFLAVFEFLLFLSEFVAGLGNDDPTGRAAPRTGAFLLISLFCALTARQTWRGYRGGLVLAVLTGLFVTCMGVSLTSAPAPFNLLSAVPLAAGVVLIVLLLAPARSRAWFRPRR